MGPHRGILWFVAVLSPCFLGLIVSFSVARYILKIDPPEAVSIAIECCYQNTGLAMTVALTVFNSAEANVAKDVPLVYGFGSFCSIVLLGLIAWKSDWTYAPPSLPFSECFFGNHQPSGEALAKRMGNTAEPTTVEQ